MCYNRNEAQDCIFKNVLKNKCFGKRLTKGTNEWLEGMLDTFRFINLKTFSQTRIRGEKIMEETNKRGNARTNVTMMRVSVAMEKQYVWHILSVCV
jgi:hypothetical protein